VRFDGTLNKSALPEAEESKRRTVKAERKKEKEREREREREIFLA